MNHTILLVHHPPRVFTLTLCHTEAPGPPSPPLPSLPPGLKLVKGDTAQTAACADPGIFCEEAI